MNRLGILFALMLLSGSSLLAQVSTANPGQVRLTSPTDGAIINGEILLTASSIDELADITFYVDEAPLGTSVTTPFQKILDTRTLSEGTHTFMARWGSVEHSATVYVDNDDTPLEIEPSPRFILPSQTSYQIHEGEVLRLDLSVAGAEGTVSFEIELEDGSPPPPHIDLFDNNRVLRWVACHHDLDANGAAQTHELFIRANFETDQSILKVIQVTVLPRIDPSAPIIRVRHGQSQDHEYLSNQEILSFELGGTNSATEFQIVVWTPNSAGDLVAKTDHVTPPNIENRMIPAWASEYSVVDSYFKRPGWSWKAFKYKPYNGGSIAIHGEIEFGLWGEDQTNPTIPVASNYVSLQLKTRTSPYKYKGTEAIYLMPLVKNGGAGTFDSQWGSGPENLHAKPAMTLTGAVELKTEFRTYQGGIQTFGGTPPTVWVEYRLNDEVVAGPALSSAAVTLNSSILSTNGTAHLSVSVVFCDDPAYNHRWNPRGISVAVGTPDDQVAQLVPAPSLTYMSSLVSERFDAFTWPGYLDSSNLTGVPLSNSVDPDHAPPASTETVADGAPASSWFLVPLLHTASTLYQPEPHIYRTDGNAVVAAGLVTARLKAQSELVVANDKHKRFDWWCGPRGSASISPYSTFAPHPLDRGFVGIDVDGRLFRIFPDGQVATMAGPVNHRYGPHRAPILFTVGSGSVFLGDKDTVGTFSGGPSGFNMPNDLAFDPQDANVIYVADTLNHRIAKVVLPVPGGSNGQPTDPGFYDATQVSTLVGLPLQPPPSAYDQYVDGAVGLATFNKPWSLAFDPSDPTSLYVADKASHAIRLVDLSGATPVVSTVLGGNLSTSPRPNRDSVYGAWKDDNDVSIQLAETHVTNDLLESSGQPLNYCDAPAVVRFDSHGYIVFAEDYIRGLRKFDPTPPSGTSIVDTIETIGRLDGGITAKDTWVWIAVDKDGLTGKQDSILTTISQGSSNNAVRRYIPLDNAINGFFWERMRLTSNNAANSNTFFPGSSGGPFLTGRADKVNLDARAHYPWAVTIDDHEPRVLTSGFGTVGLALTRKSYGGASEPSNFDTHAYEVGEAIMAWGTVDEFPRHSRPSFAALHGFSGHTRLGAGVRNFDSILDDLSQEADPDAALSSFVQGGMDGSVSRPEITGRDLEYLKYYIRRNSLSGLSNVLAAPQSPTDTVPPVVTGVVVRSTIAVTSGFIDLEVDWTTDEPTTGTFTIGGSALEYLSRIYDISGELSTSHKLVLRNVKNDASVLNYITIITKDEAGNATHHRL